MPKWRSVQLPTKLALRRADNGKKFCSSDVVDTRRRVVASRPVDINNIMSMRQCLRVSGPHPEVDNWLATYLHFQRFYYTWRFAL